MATSLYEAWLDVSTTIMEEAPIDPFLARALINNAQHFADQEAQVRAAWSVKKGGTAYPFTLTTTGTKYNIFNIGPYPATVHSTGVAYPIRVRMYGHVSTGTTTVWVVYSAYNTRWAELAALGTNYATAQTASTTVVDLSLDPVILSVTAAKTLDMYSTIATQTELSGDADTIRVPMATISLWASTSQGGSTFTIDEFYAAEYCGL